MGVAASVIGGGQTLWTASEAEENEKTIQIQNLLTGFISEHFFYGFPTRAAKQSDDPLSALWVEVSMEILKELEDRNDEIENKVNNTLLNAVPTGVLIDKIGNIKAIFVKSNITYELCYHDVKDAIVSSGKMKKEMQIIPDSPFLEFAGLNIMKIRWSLSHPAGLSQRVELQFVSALVLSNNEFSSSEKIDEVVSNNRNIKKPKEIQWQVLSTRNWGFEYFDSFILENLQPGTGYYFRLKIWSHEGWSPFSKMSALCSTQASIPSQPSAPIIAVLMPTCAQLRWTKVNANGSKIKWYILRGKGIGGENFEEIYKGPLNSYLVMSLRSESEYSFEVAAENSIGISDFSPIVTGTTLPMKCSRNNLESPQMIAAMNCREAWSECWDPKIEKYFYFNSLLGISQITIPAAMVTSIEDSTTSSTKVPIIDEKKNAEMAFRKKRFRLLKSIHLYSSTQKKNFLVNDSSQINPVLKRQNDVFLVELRRSHLLADGYRALHKERLTTVCNRMKVSFKDEEGIDSGGLSKEAFLLLSKNAVIFAGTLYKNWMVQHNLTKTSGIGDKKSYTDGGLFFTEVDLSEESNIKVLKPSIIKRKSSMSIFAPLKAIARRSSWKQESGTNGTSVVTNNKLTGVSDSKDMIDTVVLASISKSFRNKVILDGDISPGGTRSTEVKGGGSSIEASRQILEDEEHISRDDFFKFLGRFVGKALYDRQLIDLPLAPLLLKHMVGDIAQDNIQKNKKTITKVNEVVSSSNGSKTPPIQLRTIVLPKTTTSRSTNGKLSKPIPPPQKISAVSTSDDIAIPEADTVNPSYSDDKSEAMTMKIISSLSVDHLSCGDNTDTPPGYLLSEDDLADFPDEIIPIARYFVGKPLLQALLDVKCLDPILYKSLLWMLNNDITDVIDETFCVSSSDRTVPLCKDGETREVNQDNKYEYVELVARWKTTFSVAVSLNPFLQAFHELVPLKALRDAEITPAELGLMLNGRYDIDVEELRPYVIFQGNLDEQHEIVLWLWQAMREMEIDSRRSLLMFFTGCTRIPLDGFDPPLNITEGVDMVVDSLPKAHTCFNQLVIPRYSSFNVMKERIIFAIENTEGFELA